MRVWLTHVDEILFSWFSLSCHGSKAMNLKPLPLHLPVTLQSYDEIASKQRPFSKSCTTLPVRIDFGKM